MNAIIIAAGMGTRLNPITLSTPKPLVKIFGKPMIEKSIEYLLQEGIEEIVIVTGYMKDKFEYLRDKYKEVKLIYNPKYKEYNNIYSFYLVREFLKDSYILDGDIYLTRNIFKKEIDESKYFSKKINMFNNEWQLLLNNDGKIRKVEIGGSENYIMSGISFFTNKDCQKLKKIVEIYVKDEIKLKKYYWDHIIKENIHEFDIGIEKIQDNIIYEIDNLEELVELDKSYKDMLPINSFQNEIQKLKEILISNLKIDLKDIGNIEFIGGMTNKNYLVEINSKKYVLRKPGEGTESIINRHNEKNNLKLVSKINIDSNLYFFDEKSGIKLSEYINNSEMLTPSNAKYNLEEVAFILKKLHNSQIIFPNIFDPFKEMKRYEELINKEDGKFYEGYFELKKEVFKLKEVLKSFNIELVSCHNDTVPENFLKKGNNLFLIDWEYSGLNDPIWDLAAFSIESNLSDDEEKELLDYYFENSINSTIKIRMEVHKICQDFLWSIWTIFKEMNGVSFGEYGIKRLVSAQKRLEDLKLWINLTDME